MVGRHKRVVPANITQVCSGVVFRRAGPDDARFLAQPVAGHAVEIVGGSLGNHTPFVPHVLGILEVHQLGINARPLGKFHQGIDRGAALAGRIHGLFGQRIAALTAAVHTVALAPEGRRKHKVGVLQGYGIGEGLDAHNERIRVGHGLVNLVQVGQGMRGICLANNHALHITTAKGLKQRHGMVTRVGRNAPFRQVPQLFHFCPVLGIGNGAPSGQQMRQRARIAHAAAGVGLAGERK